MSELATAGDSGGGSKLRRTVQSPRRDIIEASMTVADPLARERARRADLLRRRRERDQTLRAAAFVAGEHAQRVPLLQRLAAAFRSLEGLRRAEEAARRQQARRDAAWEAIGLSAQAEDAWRAAMKTPQPAQLAVTTLRALIRELPPSCTDRMVMQAAADGGPPILDVGVLRRALQRVPTDQAAEALLDLAASGLVTIPAGCEDRLLAVELDHPDVRLTHQEAREPVWLSWQLARRLSEISPIPRPRPDVIALLDPVVLDELGRP